VDIIELTRQLIDIPSVTGDEPAVCDFLARYLEHLGYRVETQEVEKERANIIATTGARPLVMLSTHMDTVPPHIASHEDEDYIYGRGACDAKGIIAAQLMAAEALRAAGVTEFGLLFTVDEEVGSLGAQIANTHKLAQVCRYLINGEPTDNRLAIGSKGSLRVIVKTTGRAAHSAYPEMGESAIEKLLDVLADIRASAWPSDDYFGETTCNIGVINAGTRSNVIPAEARADLFLRLAIERAHVKERLEKLIAGRAEIEYLSGSDPVRMLGLQGFEQCVVRFMTDIPYLPEWGTPLLLGPGSIHVAHTIDERISKPELSEAVVLYQRLVRTLLAREDKRHETEENANLQGTSQGANV
jgi:acetylornithine deacetylase